MIKVGDKVRVILNSVRANINNDGKKISAGDVVEVTDVINSPDDFIGKEDITYSAFVISFLPVIYYRLEIVKGGTSIEPKNFLPLKDVELVTPTCTCDISLLMTSGCKCGAIAMERSRDKA